MAYKWGLLTTLPETNIAPENETLGVQEIPDLEFPSFLGVFAVSFREGSY